MPAPILDTHVWVWWVQADPRLDHRTVAALDALPPDDRPGLCDISLWEVAMLVTLGRLTFGEPLESWLDAAADPRTVRVLPVTPAIAGTGSTATVSGTSATSVFSAAAFAALTASTSAFPSRNRWRS